MTYIRKDISGIEYAFDTLEEYSSFLQKLINDKVTGVYANHRIKLIKVFNLPKVN